MKNLKILDPEYEAWVKNLCSRYRASQIKAAVKVNTEMLKYYWDLGRDIVQMNVEKRWGESVIVQLSHDLRQELPGVQGLSKTNIYYCRKFYSLYNSENEFFHQVGGKLSSEEFFHQVEGIFRIPWRHHCLIMDRVKGDAKKALFYVRETVNNGWSRAMLMNWIDTDLYERQGKALTNFKTTLPAPNSDLAIELTKDPYNFAFTEVIGRYNERLLKDALLNHISQFLIELGTGFAYVGKEYHLQVGNTENFIDLLFYNLNLSCYVVIEVKIGEFKFADAGQLGGYVVACNHMLRKEGRDNPTIGLLICKSKDKIQAQYALEASNQPIAISEYDLERFYPAKIEGTIPTIEDLEKGLMSDETNR